MGWSDVWVCLRFGVVSRRIVHPAAQQTFPQVGWCVKLWIRCFTKPQYFTIKSVNLIISVRFLPFFPHILKKSLFLKKWGWGGVSNSAEFACSPRVSSPPATLNSGTENEWMDEWMIKCMAYFQQATSDLLHEQQHISCDSHVTVQVGRWHLQYFLSNLFYIERTKSDCSGMLREY